MMAGKNDFGFTEQYSVEVYNEVRQTVGTVVFDGTTLAVDGLERYRFGTYDKPALRSVLYLTMARPDDMIPADQLISRARRMYGSSVLMAQAFYEPILTPAVGYNPVNLTMGTRRNKNEVLPVLGATFVTRLKSSEKTRIETNTKKQPAQLYLSTKDETQVERKNREWTQALRESDGELNLLDFSNIEPAITALLAVLHININVPMSTSELKKAFLDYSHIEEMKDKEFNEILQRMVRSYQAVALLKERIKFEIRSSGGFEEGYFWWATLRTRL